MQKILKKIDLKQIFIFGLVGGGGALAYVILLNLALLNFPKLHKPVLSVLCYALLIPIIYLLQYRFSFESKAPHSIAFPKYVTTQLIALAANFILSFIAFEIIKMPNLFGSVAIVCLTSFGSFAILKLWAFRTNL